MHEKVSRTPAEIFASELEREDRPDCLFVSACEIQDPRTFVVRFVIGGMEAFYSAADSRKIAAGIIACAEFCEREGK